MNTTQDDGGPAFPHSSQPLDRQGNPIMENHSEWGMSLRDWFAGMALQGLLVGYDGHELTTDECVTMALKAADSMLAARKEKP